MFKNVLTSALAGIGLVWGTMAVAADKPANFPTRPIELIVVQPAGGGMDISARTLAQVVEANSDLRFRVVNQTGGAGKIGYTQLGKQAKKDGYTLGVFSTPSLAIGLLGEGTPYTLADFDPLVFFNFDPELVITKGKKLEDLIRQAKEHPGEVRVATSPGSPVNYVYTLIERKTGAKFRRVPFRGGAPRLTALLQGTVDIAVGFYAEGSQFFANGDLTPVAVAEAKRLSYLPNVPTLDELGIEAGAKNFGAARVIVGPKGLPADVRSYLVDSFLRSLSANGSEAAFDKLGMKVEPGGPDDATASVNQAVKLIAEYAPLEPKE